MISPTDVNIAHHHKDLGSGADWLLRESGMKPHDPCEKLDKFRLISVVVRDLTDREQPPNLAREGEQDAQKPRYTITLGKQLESAGTRSYGNTHRMVTYLG